MAHLEKIVKDKSKSNDRSESIDSLHPGYIHDGKMASN